MQHLQKHGKCGALYKAIREIEKANAQVRAKVEHSFRVIKRQFDYTKVRFRALIKNTVQMVTLFAPSNLWMVRRISLLMQERFASDTENGCCVVVCSG